MAQKKADLAQRVEQKAEARASGQQKTMDEWIVQYADDFLAAMPPARREELEEQFVRLALNELRWQPDLRGCDPFSVIGALMTTAQLGLQPSGPLDHVYLIPRNVNVGTREQPQWVKRAQLIVGYQGFRELALRTGASRSVIADVVHEGDEFEYGREGAEVILRHRPPKLGTARGNVVGAYGLATMIDGSIVARVIDLEDIGRAQRSSDLGSPNRRGGARGPWVDHYEAMVRKTAIRRLWNDLPRTPQAAIAYQIDGATIAHVPEAALEDMTRPQLDMVASHDDVGEEQEEKATDEDVPDMPADGQVAEDPERPFTDDEKGDDDAK